MKNQFNQIMALCAIGILAIIISGCQNEDFSNENLQENLTSNFGVVHNEVIGEIYANLPQSKTRSATMTKGEFQSLCVEQAGISTLQRDNTLSPQLIERTIADVSLRTVDEIKVSMDDRDRQIIDAICIMIREGKNRSTIEGFIFNSNLNEQKTQAALNFYETYEASKTYWSEHGEEWICYIQENVELKPETRASWYEKISWSQVAFSDAYYGWQGTLASGCNVYVGAGSAAAGSIFSALNQL